MTNPPTAIEEAIIIEANPSNRSSPLSVTVPLAFRVVIILPVNGVAWVNPASPLTCASVTARQRIGRNRDFNGAGFVRSRDWQCFDCEPQKTYQLARALELA